MKLLLSPHNDDECLFAAYTLIREKPLVIIATDSDAQLAGWGITADQRREESRRACELLGVAVVFLGLKDGTLDQQRADLKRWLKPFASLAWTLVYAPAVQGGHTDHDALGEVVSSMFSPVSYYATYAYGEVFTPAGNEVEPTQEEIDRKNSALDCYPSQIGLPENKQHFDAVRGRSEYLCDTPRPRR